MNLKILEALNSSCPSSDIYSSQNVNHGSVSNKMNMLISSESRASISNVNRKISENYRNKSQQEPENEVEISLVAD